jgi:hypothetical protein
MSASSSLRVSAWLRVQGGREAVCHRVGCLSPAWRGRRRRLVARTWPVPPPSGQVDMTRRDEFGEVLSVVEVDGLPEWRGKVSAAFTQQPRFAVAHRSRVVRSMAAAAMGCTVAPSRAWAQLVILAGSASAFVVTARVIVSG